MKAISRIFRRKGHIEFEQTRALTTLSGLAATLANNGPKNRRSYWAGIADLASDLMYMTGGHNLGKYSELNNTGIYAMVERVIGGEDSRTVAAELLAQ